MRFWLRKGVDGFRVDSSGFLYEDKLYRDEPLSGKTNDPNNPDYTIKTYTTDQPESYEIVRVFRQVLDEFEQPKLLMMEDYASLPAVMKYYRYGADLPFNFALIMQVDKNSKASDFKKVIDQWMSNMPAGGTANWVVSYFTKYFSCNITFYSMLRMLLKLMDHLRLIIYFTLQQFTNPIDLIIS